MAKGVSKELEKAIREILNEGINKSQDEGSKTLALNWAQGINSQAIRYLGDRGFIDTNEEYRDYLRITASGRDYYEKLTTFAPWYWFKQNAFAATVAFATIATSVSGIVFNALD